MAFERSVNPEGSETCGMYYGFNLSFERSVNPEGSETLTLLCNNVTPFERSVNPEGSETNNKNISIDTENAHDVGFFICWGL